MKQQDGMQNNTGKVFLLALFLMTPTQAHPVGFCDDVALGSGECEKVACPNYYESYLGAWQGKVVLSEFKELGTLPRQRIFSKHACLKNVNTGKIYLIGKQTVAVPAFAESGARNLVSTIVLERDSLSIVRSPTEFTSYTRKDGALAGEEIIWESDTPKKRLVWRSGPPRTTRSFSITELHGSGDIEESHVLERGEESLLQRGQKSYFSGKTWVFTADGKLVGSSEILLKKIYNPKTGMLTEHTVSYEEKSKVKTWEDAVVVYDVTSESLPAPYGGRSSSASVGKGRTINLYEFYRDASLYSESRVIGKDGRVSSLNFQRAEPLSEGVYRETASEIRKANPRTEGGKIPLR